MLFESISSITEEELKEIDSEGLASYLSDPFTRLSGVVRDDDGKIIVIGMVRIVNEFKIIVNKKQSNYKVVKSISWLLQKALDYCYRSGSNEVYAIITDGGLKYEEVLQKHFNFHKIDGTPLRMEL